MATPSIPVSAAERARLDNCVREPIRRPGSVQAHGVLLTADRTGWTIRQCSENTAAPLGRPADELLGTSLVELIGREAVDRISAVIAGTLGAANPVRIVRDAVPYDVIVHEADGVAVIEFELALPAEDFHSVPAVYAALSRLDTATSRDQLWDDTARALHRLTGFDQVMVYHFHPDGHGQVVAEHRADDSIESYLGLHYPASDIPAQARDLYLTKVSRTIADTGQTALPLLPAESPTTKAPLDLSRAELRSISGHHRQFMLNMGQAATLSFSLIVDGELVGLITCAHRTPRRLPFSLRQALEVFAGHVAVRLGAMSQISRLALATELLGVRKRLVEQFSSSGDLAAALLRGPVTMLDLVPASAAAVHLDGRTSMTGDMVDRTGVDGLVAQLLAGGTRLPFATDSLASEHPALARMLPAIAGVLIVPFGQDGDYLAWFRPEMTEAIRWLGDQSESNRDSTFSAKLVLSLERKRFGVAESWGTVEAEATELGRDLDAAFLRTVEANLAHVALHDSLTGLPNRRLFMDRLEHALAAYARGRDIAVLFIDIDSFKWFNDVLGHDAGDAALVQVAERLLSITRAADTVARLGGDEFVALCEDTDMEEALGIAERMLDALRPPLTLGIEQVPATASIGVATARPGDTAAALLRRADASMYRAKRSGKGQAAR